MATSSPPVEPDPIDTVAALTRLPEHGLGGRRKRRPERHDEILSAAVHLFAARGYHNTSVEDIAEAVGVSATAVYRHFRTKQEVLDTAAVWVADQLAQRLLAVNQRLTGTRQLEWLVGELVDTTQEFPEFVGLFASEMNSLSPEARALTLEHRGTYVSGFRQVLREVMPGLRPKDADLRIHLVIGLVTSITSWRERGRNGVTDTVKAAAMAALLSK
jgi:AcrR family transcriptional regulator